VSSDDLKEGSHEKAEEAGKEGRQERGTLPVASREGEQGGHQEEVVAKPGPGRRWLSRESPLNQPFIIVVATALLQIGLWTWQQQRTAARSVGAAAASQANAALEQMVGLVGKRLTASGLVVGAHEQQFELEQLRWAINQYNELSSDWDLSEDLLGYRLRLSFPDEELQRGWQNLRDRLDELDKRVLGLRAFDTTDPSPEHRREVEDCRRQIESLEGDLNKLARSLAERLSEAQR
jgi:hypothetical protein